MGGLIAARLNFFGCNLYFNHISLLSDKSRDASVGVLRIVVYGILIC